MIDHSKAVETHGCIVCGKLFTLLVLYDADGNLVDCTVTSPRGRIVKDPQRPLVACDRHTEEQIKAALTTHYPGQTKDDIEEGW